MKAPIKLCLWCHAKIRNGHKNKEYCTPGVDPGRACRQLAYLARKKEGK